MAIIYQAELSPTKPEVLRELLTSRPWGEDGELEVLGAYRFDDPSGEVGVECHLVRVGESIYHLPLTYRGAPLEDPAAQLVTTMDHSVLGTRYVYDGLEDELAIECFARALAGEQQQAVQGSCAPDGTPAGRSPSRRRLGRRTRGRRGLLRARGDRSRSGRRGSSAAGSP